MPYHRNSVHSNGYSIDAQQPVGRERDEGPTYLMEHLATFRVSKETGIVYPADGMRRLLQMEKSNGIWSQKMQLRLDKNMVLILDYETGAVMEKFPASSIQEPTAFTRQDPIELYNNSLVFIVGDERQPNSHSEMHIFQCQMISAQELVEDLKLLRAGKTPGQRGSRHIPPPPPTPPPEPPLNGVSVREQVNVFNAASQSDGRGGSDLGAVNHDDETSSTSSEKYGRDVTTLNHCFDDIEKFIARLQHAAAASRELERRRKKSKKKNMGDGMLTMRAKPPPESEFIDIFQKFKLSFILLAKLKQHIHDPNAPELVHFLFTPLALIVDASHDTNYGPNLPSKVVSPLLTQEAIHLLVNCVTSKETELWHSLGDAWLIPRDMWKGYVEPYHPVFLDGWSPDYPVIDDRDERREVASSTSVTKQVRGPAPTHEADLREVHYREREREDMHYSSDYFDYDHQGSSPTDQPRYSYEPRNYSRNERYSREERVETQSPGDIEPGPPPPPRSDISADSIERTGGPGAGGERFERAQSRWLEDLRALGAKIVQVTYPRTANNDKELSVIRGEFLQVLDDSRKWWKARNSRGEVAHVPHTIVTPYQPSDTDVFGGSVYPRGYYHSQEERLNRGGVIPAPPPAPPAAQPAPAPADWVRKERLDYKSMTSMSEISSTCSSFRDDSPEKETSDRELFQMELKNALSMLKEKPAIQIKKTPEVYIDSSSKPEDVKKWLKQKKFSARVCQQLDGMTGMELFKLDKEQIESLCGFAEGKRLNSQLLVQRNISGYKTTRNAELNEKLAKVRMKFCSTEEED